MKREILLFLGTLITGLVLVLYLERSSFDPSASSFHDSLAKDDFTYLVEFANQLDHSAYKPNPTNISKPIFENPLSEAGTNHNLHDPGEFPELITEDEKDLKDTKRSEGPKEEDTHDGKSKSKKESSIPSFFSASSGSTNTISELNSLERLKFGELHEVEISLEKNSHLLEGFKVSFNERARVYNPSFVHFENRNWMFARLEGKNASHTWSSCPLKNLDTSIPCPAQDIRMISFNIQLELSSSFQPLEHAKMQVLEYEIDWNRVARERKERELGPEDPRAFEWNHEVFVAFNGAPSNHSLFVNHMERLMKIQKVLPIPKSSSGSSAVSDIHNNIGQQQEKKEEFVSPIIELRLSNSNFGKSRVEKNWSPIASLSLLDLRLIFSNPSSSVSRSHRESNNNFATKLKTREPRPLNLTLKMDRAMASRIERLYPVLFSAFGPHRSLAGQGKSQNQHNDEETTIPYDLDLNSPSGEHQQFFLFSRFLEPHQIIACSSQSRADSDKGNCDIVSSTSHVDYFSSFMSKRFYRALHLGTNAIQLDDGRFMAIFHGLKGGGSGLYGGPKRYFNHVYLFESQYPWRITHVSEQALELPLGFLGHGFVYTSGLWMFDPSHCVISYNINDRSSNFLIVALNDLIGNLTSI